MGYTDKHGAFSNIFFSRQLHRNDESLRRWRLNQWLKLDSDACRYPPEESQCTLCLPSKAKLSTVRCHLDGYMTAAFAANTAKEGIVSNVLSKCSCRLCIDLEYFPELVKQKKVSV